MRRLFISGIGFSSMPLSRNSSIAVGVVCILLTISFYSVTHTTGLGSFVTECSRGAESINQYQQYLLRTLQVPSEQESLQDSQVPHHAYKVGESKLAKPGKGAKSGKGGTLEPKISSKAAQSAYDATLRLQYALSSSTISKVEGPNLLGMAKHISTFALLLEAILNDTSIDRKPFHQLRKQYFAWFRPSDTTHLPWLAKNNTTGIVMTAGQKNMVFAMHAIRTLRNVINTTLPIQVAYAGDDDLPAEKRREMRAIDPSFELINVRDYYDEDVAGLGSGGWAMKPFAALASRFEKVILIDTDTIFMQRPDELFEVNAGLKQTGTLFFHDRALKGRRTTEWVEELLNTGGRTPSTTLNSSMYWQEELEHQQESGVVFINKAVPGAFMSLLFTTYMNLKSVRAEIYGHVMGASANPSQRTWPERILHADLFALGDKETFWLASELAGIPYTFHPSYAGTIGHISLNDEGLPEICSLQPLQTDLHGRPFWFNSAIREDKTDTEHREYANLSHFIPGGTNEPPGWRYLHDYTYCLGRSLQEMHSVKDAGLEEVVQDLIAEARAVDELIETRKTGL